MDYLSPSNFKRLKTGVYEQCLSPPGKITTAYASNLLFSGLLFPDLEYSAFFSFLQKSLRLVYVFLSLRGRLYYSLVALHVLSVGILESRSPSCMSNSSKSSCRGYSQQNGDFICLYMFWFTPSKSIYTSQHLLGSHFSSSESFIQTDVLSYISVSQLADGEIYPCLSQNRIRHIRL
jgi:hypothetical protein